jgi:hypothetical protein
MEVMEMEHLIIVGLVFLNLFMIVRGGGPVLFPHVEIQTSHAAGIEL